MDEEIEKISQSSKKPSKWALTSLMYGILAILAAVLPSIILYLRDTYSVLFSNRLLDRLFHFVFLILLPVLSILTLVFGIIGLKREEKKLLSWVGTILGIVMLSIAFIFLWYTLFPRWAKASDARVMATMSQIRAKAEIVKTEEGSYSSLTCNYDHEMWELCDDIEEHAGSKPIILSTDKEYCAYIKLKSGEYFCVDSTGAAKRTAVNPGKENCCDGTTFICPESLP